MDGQTLFGSDGQRAALARGRALYELTRDDPRYTYYGRTVGIPTQHDVPPERFRALIDLQGNTSITEMPRDEAHRMAGALTAEGLSVTRYARWETGAESLGLAQTLLSEVSLPADLQIERITPDLPQARREAFADGVLSCGVLPPSLEVLSGALKPGVAVMAVDPSGRAVSCSGAAGFLHADHPEGREITWWGMLATRPERRGQRLSLYMGALTMRDMADRFGFTRFMTGIERGNAASEAVCTRLGLRDTGSDIVVVADPGQLPGGRMTK